MSQPFPGYHYAIIGVSNVDQIVSDEIERAKQGTFYRTPEGEIDLEALKEGIALHVQQQCRIPPEAQEIANRQGRRS